MEFRDFHLGNEDQSNPLLLTFFDEDKVVFWKYHYESVDFSEPEGS